MENELLIREIRIEDADVIDGIQSAITQEPSRIDFKHIIEEQLPKKEAISFVAELGGRVVGYMISYVIYGGYGLENSAWIATLGVDPKFMGRGIGKRLAEEIFQVYRNRRIKHIFTSVRWDSVDLLSFFKTLGFDRSNFINLKKDLDI
ncbi:MAG: GNAT family N-acetyltransferase [Deltaproteobacteria bacterium]|nr:GNAT family N-acetyltransferase [Deltaproteobacteria bacterium]MBW1817039.1 GNAT family N-acetyltransferase [Deltaproteobacteria bacterium]